ncbi:MAG: rhomboid family intramembrane serine protease [Myxococcales bacterium]|nr:MAG: rhomboid family intramembrane serine protease [Myxococcales bacterium]
MPPKTPTPYLTIALAALLVVLHGCQWMFWLDSTVLSLDRANVNLLSFFANPFLHGNPLHLLATVVFLVICGGLFETRIGFRFTLAVFVIGSYIGVLFWLVLGRADSDPLIGSSAGVTALAIAATLYRPSNTGILAAALYILSQMFLAPVVDFTTTSWPLHFGGSIVGLVAFGVAWHYQLGMSGGGQSMRAPLGGLLKRGDRPLTSVRTKAELQAEVQAAVANSALSSREDRTTQLHAVGLDEMALKKAINANQGDIDAHCQLLEIYFVKNRSAEAGAQGKRLIRMLCEAGEEGRAYEFYHRLVEKFGPQSLNTSQLASLARNRLEAGDWSAAAPLLEEFRRIEPMHVMLPDLVCRLARLMVQHLGQESDVSRIWLENVFTDYPAHPSTIKLRAELGIDTKTMKAFMPLEGKDIVVAIQAGEYETAAEMLLDNNKLVDDVEPMLLYRLALQIVKSQKTLAQGVMILELTVRAHLTDANTPNLIYELIVLYRNRMEKAGRARQWYEFLKDRWPQSQAARQAREIMEKASSKPG